MQVQSQRCKLVETFLSNCVAGALSGDYATLPGKTLQFKDVRAASKSGAFGTASKQVELSCRGSRGGVIISGVVGRTDTYVKLCAPRTPKNTVRVMRYFEDAWVGCAVESIAEKKMRAHVIAWCAVVLGVAKEIRQAQASVATELDAATSLNAHVVACDKAKKALCKIEASLKRNMEKKEDAAKALQEAQACLEEARKKRSAVDGDGDGESHRNSRKRGRVMMHEGRSMDEDGDENGDDRRSGVSERKSSHSEEDDADAEDGDRHRARETDVRVLKACRELYRKSEEAYHTYHRAKKEARKRHQDDEDAYKTAKECAKTEYRKHVQAIKQLRKENRDNLKKLERSDLLTVATTLGGGNDSQSVCMADEELN